jgi:hypothetical protein
MKDLDANKKYFCKDLLRENNDLLFYLKGDFKYIICLFGLVLINIKSLEDASYTLPSLK